MPNKKRRNVDVAADAMGGFFSKSLSVEALSNEPYNQAWNHESGKITPFVVVTGADELAKGPNHKCKKTVASKRLEMMNPRPDDSMTPHDVSLSFFVFFLCGLNSCVHGVFRYDIEYIIYMNILEWCVLISALRWATERHICLRA